MCLHKAVAVKTIRSQAVQRRVEPAWASILLTGLGSASEAYAPLSRATPRCDFPGGDGGRRPLPNENGSTGTGTRPVRSGNVCTKGRRKVYAAYSLAELWWAQPPLQTSGWAPCNARCTSKLQAASLPRHRDRPCTPGKRLALPQNRRPCH